MTRLDAWLCTEVGLISFTDERGGREKILYWDKFQSMLLVTDGELIGTLRKYVDYWKPNEMNVGSQSETVEALQLYFIEMKRYSTIVINSQDLALYYVAIGN